MLKNPFDPKNAYKFVRYGRMSSDRQNPRSPDQQFDTIKNLVQRLGYNWQWQRDYRDDGISGRFRRKRLGLQQMLSDIKTKRIFPDLILVDTLERFGRAADIQQLRRELYNRYGVLVLTADSAFADPTSVAGQALGMVENMRATEDNRIKAHNVVRGKRDAVQRGHWPGGKPPYGYCLESVLKTVHGQTQVDYCQLVPDARQAPVIQLLFAQAATTGWGASRLAKFLNVHAAIPAELKPFRMCTVALWLQSPIYIGRLVWGKVSTDVVDDRRVLQSNASADQTVMENFCEPLVEPAIWEQVQTLVNSRKQSNRARVWCKY